MTCAWTWEVSLESDRVLKERVKREKWNNKFSEGVIRPVLVSEDVYGPRVTESRSSSMKFELVQGLEGDNGVLP